MSKHRSGLPRESAEPHGGVRRTLRTFAERWAVVGEVLDDERRLALQALDDDTARRMMADLFRLWRPTEPELEGRGLVEQQRLFRALGGRRPGDETRR
jgi:hypothetical protein